MAEKKKKTPRVNSKKKMINKIVRKESSPKKTVTNRKAITKKEIGRAHV